MPLIGVIVKEPFDHEGRSYVPGESLELPAKPFLSLLARGMVRLPTRRDRMTPISGTYERADMTPAKPARKRRTYKRKDLVAK